MNCTNTDRISYRRLQDHAILTVCPGHTPGLCDPFLYQGRDSHFEALPVVLVPGIQWSWKGSFSRCTRSRFQDWSKIGRHILFIFCP